MYIYKTVFTERDEFTDEEYQELYNNGIIWETDYGTVEIAHTSLEDISDELKEVLVKRIGAGVVELLENGGLDFVLVV